MQRQRYYLQTSTTRPYYYCTVTKDTKYYHIPNFDGQKENRARVVQLILYY
jgi:hypothetical protein